MRNKIVIGVLATALIVGVASVSGQKEYKALDLPKEKGVVTLAKLEEPKNRGLTKRELKTASRDSELYSQDPSVEITITDRIPSGTAETVIEGTIGTDEGCSGYADEYLEGAGEADGTVEDDVAGEDSVLDVSDCYESSEYSIYGQDESCEHYDCEESEQSDNCGVDEAGQSESSGEYYSESDVDTSVQSGSELTYLGQWTATAYCPNACCCGEYASGYTASGTQATEGRTIACNSLPFGTQLMIDGNIYTVEDTGWSPYGENWVDIFFLDHDSALAYGMRTVDVYLVE